MGRQDRAGGGAWTSPPHTLGRSRARQAQPAVAGWAGSALGCSGTGRVGLGSKPTTAPPLLLRTHTPRAGRVHTTPGAQSEPSLSLCPLHSSPGASFLRVGTTCQWHCPFPDPSCPPSELHPGPAEVCGGARLFLDERSAGPETHWAPPKLMPHAASTATSGHAAPTPHPHQPSPKSQGPRVKAAPRAERAEHPHLAGLVGVTRRAGATQGPGLCVHRGAGASSSCPRAPARPATVTVTGPTGMGAPPGVLPLPRVGRFWSPQIRARRQQARAPAGSASSVAAPQQAAPLHTPGPPGRRDSEWVGVPAPSGGF